MEKGIENMNNAYDFMPVPISELVQGNEKLGKYHFVIPSFQRGYRWEEKQVIDLLNDIKQFADDDDKDNKTYYLQPIVVKSTSEANTWDVIDGQQRLTTLLLILKHLLNRMSEDEKNDYVDFLYDIKYTNRPNIDFDNLRSDETIDSYYLSEAKETINKWFKLHKRKNLDGFKGVLFYEQKRQVKIIWYPIDKKYQEVDSINIFNRLNNGKIGLTSSELIKALFVLGSKLDKDIDTKILSIEWDNIERKLQEDSFWFFISDNSKGYQTRIDLLFDFVTEKPDGGDLDFSYRKFQNLFDFYKDNSDVELDQLWVKKGIKTIEQAWNHIKVVYDTLLSWYEDNMYYHYIGFLVAEGDCPLNIYNKICIAQNSMETGDEWSQIDSQQLLYELIMEKFKFQNKYLSIDDVNELEYNNYYLVRRILLLFNVESCRKSGNIRFSFDKYKKEKWDVEHVNSQNESTLQRPEERMDWMKKVVKKILKGANAKELELIAQTDDLIENSEKNDNKVNTDDFNSLYIAVTQYFTPASAPMNKNNIGNLTLLDSSTNREYHDAPYPYKRQCIIEKDRKGATFIPICTRNLFLKYYAEKDSDASQYDMTYWTNDDMEKYKMAISGSLSEIFNSVVKKGDNNEK